MFIFKTIRSLITLSMFFFVFYIGFNKEGKKWFTHFLEKQIKTARNSGFVEQTFSKITGLKPRDIMSLQPKAHDLIPEEESANERSEDF